MTESIKESKTVAQSNVKHSQKGFLSPLWHGFGYLSRIGSSDPSLNASGRLFSICCFPLIGLFIGGGASLIAYTVPKKLFYLTAWAIPTLWLLLRGDKTSRAISKLSGLDSSGGSLISVIIYVGKVLALITLATFDYTVIFYTVLLAPVCSLFVSGLIAISLEKPDTLKNEPSKIVGAVIFLTLATLGITMFSTGIGLALLSVALLIALVFGVLRTIFSPAKSLTLPLVSIEVIEMVLLWVPSISLICGLDLSLL